MDKYIGLDVHAISCTAAVVNGQGRRLGSHVIETNGKALVEFFKAQKGNVRLCMEEGTQSTWLVEILSAYVDEVVVVHVSESRGPKDDARDAFALAERLRMGAVANPVYKKVGSFGKLRQLVKAHQGIVQDTVRVQNRLKALCRSRGIQVAGKDIYRARSREMWLAKLPTSSRGAAELLFAQYDGLCEVRGQAEKDLSTESHAHPAAAWLESCPGIGVIRAAQILAVVVTPDRFRTRSQFWAYCGLGIVMRSSSDWVQTPQGKWVRAEIKQTRGLNHNHNHMLKQVFKGAATSAIAQHPQSNIRKDYDRLLANGTKPNLAKVTIARKIAATALAIWKHKEVYDPAKISKPTS